MLKPRLDQPCSIQCILWVPGNEKRRFHATVRYENGALAINTRDSRVAATFSEAAKEMSIALLHGTADGMPISATMLVPRAAGDIRSEDGAYVVSEDFAAQAVIFGVHVGTPDFELSSCSFSFENLEVFVQGPAFQCQVFLTGDLQASISVVRPPELAFDVPSIGASVTFERTAESTPMPSWQNAAFTLESWIRLAPLKPQKASWFYEQASSIRLLLSVLLGFPTAARAVRGDVLDVDGEDLDAWALISNPRAAPVHRLSGADVFFPLPVVAKAAPDFINRWFASKSSVIAADLFVGAYANPGMYGHQHFMAIVHAIEAFHRHARHGFYMSPDEYESIAQKISSCIPALTESHRAALKSRIRYGNEFSLRKRLNELAGELTPTLKALVADDLSLLISRVVDTRNYFTHWVVDAAHPPMNDAELPDAARRMSKFLSLVFLREIGLPPEVIHARWMRTG